MKVLIQKIQQKIAEDQRTVDRYAVEVTHDRVCDVAQVRIDVFREVLAMVAQLEIDQGGVNEEHF